MAKECRVTKNTIWKRYRRLQKAGIIVGATIQMDYASFGYPAVATILVKVESTYRQQVLERLRQMTDILLIIQFNVIYNIRAVARLRNLSELDHIKETIRRQNPVIDIKTFVWTDVKNNPQNLSLASCGQTPSKEGRILVGKVGSIAKAIDDIDKKLIEILGKNGRESFRKIAKQLNISTDTVARRYEKLKENGIVRVVAQINPSKIGYQAILDFSIAHMSQKETSAIVENIAEIPDVIIIIKTSGDYDLQITAMIRDIKQQFDIQEEIARIPSITKMETSARRPPDIWPSPFQHISTF
jgi:Lrp/AsnC family transcriptional regulator, regulator for asnA, asnC and gidA